MSDASFVHPTVRRAAARVFARAQGWRPLRRAVYSGASVQAITVTVTFFADLRRFLPRGAEGPQRYAVPAGATLGDLLAAVGIEPEADVTAALDGALAERQTPLRDGADVMLLSPMEGGQ